MSSSSSSQASSSASSSSSSASSSSSSLSSSSSSSTSSALATYSTTFSLTEAPISENGRWVNNSTNRTLVDTAGGIAYGTQIGGAFDDSYARLTGTWSPNTVVEASVFRGNTFGIQEVEFLFRANDSIPGKVTLYEINFAHNGQYVDFYRWEGGIQLSEFTPLVPSLTYSIPGGINNGDRLRGQMVGNTLSAWIDMGAGWVLIGSASDTAGPNGGAVITRGTPGIGFFKTSGSGDMNQYGFFDLKVTELP